PAAAGRADKVACIVTRGTFPHDEVAIWALGHPGIDLRTGMHAEECQAREHESRRLHCSHFRWLLRRTHFSKPLSRGGHYRPDGGRYAARYSRTCLRSAAVIDMPYATMSSIVEFQPSRVRPPVLTTMLIS